MLAIIALRSRFRASSGASKNLRKPARRNTVAAARAHDVARDGAYGFIGVVVKTEQNHGRV